MTPSEADAALNDTLEDVQSLIKRCMKLKEGDSAVGLALSDEIARRVLLSCAAVVWQYSKAGVFQALPDWTTVVDDDPLHQASSKIPQDALFDQVPPTPPRTVTAPLEPLTPMYPSTAAAPSKDDPSVTGNMKTQTKTVRQPAKRKNIQAEDDATNETYGTRRPAPRPLSRQSAPKRKKKFMSDDDENHPTGSILVTRKHKSLASTANAVAGPVNPTPSDTVDKGFWDADTLGRSSSTRLLDGVVIPPLQRRRSIPFAITPESVTNVSNWMYLKHGFTRLACANCDEMKITCAIDGVGVRERLQAKLKGDEALPPKHTQIRTPKSRPTKTQAKAATTKRKKKPARVFTHAGQKDVPLDLSGDSHADQPMEGVTPHPDPLASPAMQPLETVLPPATAQPITDPTVGSGRLRHQPEPEPTARDILHSIHDLGRRFDLLATNERVDALDTRLGVMEERLDVRLTVLEKRLSASNQHWTATSSSLGNLAMALRKHKDDRMIHRPRESIAGDSQSQQHKAIYPLWSLHNTGSGDEEAASQIARQPPGVNSRRLDNARRSVSTAVPGTSLPFASSPLSSRFSSAPPGTSGE
ncbi:uncharacterized protein F5891DRAFT_981983 [Suillus fuscotomentosus]|uniref:Uncharacterized protein n=1 Tax=Suillus fuscotomentosus TaxID=1912939 RepID=A0AAD4HJD9_9AGAM|nr:uncharacterized protein F5891DRAFT_981983 [Suillus fuscotomentosus]KAG1898346.1 hypothetical protein F5891DRAFT_981983 [Suillus fuscotomentosus]